MVITKKEREVFKAMSLRYEEQLSDAKPGMYNIINLTNALNDEENFGNKKVKYWIYTSKDFMRISISYEDIKPVDYWVSMKALIWDNDEYISEIVRTLYTLLENNPRFAKEEEKGDE